MENFTTIYNERKKVNKTLNAWLYYFKPLNNTFYFSAFIFLVLALFYGYYFINRKHAK